MRIIVFFLSCLLFASNIFACEIVAIIGDSKIITSDELEQLTKLTILLKNPNNINDQNFIVFTKKQLLNELIDNKILLSHAEKVGIDLNNIDVKQDLELLNNALPKHTEILQDFLMKYEIRHEYCEQYIKSQIISHQLVISSIQKNLAPLDDEIIKLLQDMHLENTEENKTKAKRMLFEQKLTKARNDILAKLRRMYYVEVLNNS